MYRSKVSVVVVLLVALTIVEPHVAVIEAATHNIPPLFKESPTARIINGVVRTDGETGEVLDYRLPNTTEPVHYDVELTTSVHTGETSFTGTVIIEIIVNEDTSTIVLHQRQLTILTATIKEANVEGATEEELTTSYDSTREFLSLTPTNTSLNFTNDSSWILTITYEGQLRTDNGGFYLSTYTDLSGSDRYLATTQFESTDARHAFPCYDEPAKRATFSIVINHGTSYNAISNMPLNEELSSVGRSVFEKTVKMSTYLVAFIVSDFEYTEGVLNARPQRIYSRPGTVDEQEFALVSGLLLLQRLADYYEVDFALPKIYQVAVPDFAAGAMENWGLATYREEYMLYNKDTSTITTQTNIANIIAHEYCHQWFGNLVAIKWWTYLWLKEGFATLFSWQALDAAYPEWDVYQMFLTDAFQTALTSDGTGKLNPMSHYVQTPAEISARYDTISYSKAGSVLYMWQSALTDSVFQQGLHLYLTSNQYSAADEYQLFSSLAIAAGAQNVALPATMEDMFSSWSQQSGYPLLTVTRNYASKTFTVTQEAFNDDNSQTSDKTWYIPFNYAYKSNADYRNTTASHYLLKQTEITISVDDLAEDDWLILNKQSTGFFRVNYDESNWNLLIAALKSQPYRFHSRNRAQLIFDAYKFSSTERLSQSIFLDLLQYLPNEDDYAPWSTVSAVITTFNRYLSGDDDYANFQYFVASLVEGLFDKLGVNDRAGDHHLTKFTRNIAINIACMSGISSCLEETNTKLKAFVNDGVAIEPNLQSQIYCNGLRQSGDTEFDLIYNYMLESTDQALRRLLISALGCSQSESQLQKFVNSSIDTSVDLRTQERITLLSSAYSRSSVGLLVSIDFLSENWEAYSNLTAGFGGDNPLNTAVLGMASYVVNEDQETKYLALVDLVKSSDKVESNLEETVKSTISANYAWLNNNRDPIMSWVNSYGKSDSASIGASLATICTALALALARFL